MKTIVKQLWLGHITCQRCLQRRQHQLIEHTEWGTLFFIPVIPLRRTRILSCNYCNLTTKLTKAQATDLMNTVPNLRTPGL